MRRARSLFPAPHIHLQLPAPGTCFFQTSQLECSDFGNSSLQINGHKLPGLTVQGRFDWRDFFQFGVRWVFSVATMPDNEMKVLLDSHYPTLAEANRKRAQHETATGHCLRGWWMASQYMPDETE